MGPRSSLRFVWIILKHEWLLLFREPRFWIPFLLPTIVLLATEKIAALDFGKMPPEFSGLVLLYLAAFAAPMAAPLTADTFAGERERRTLELLQISPARAGEIFAAKLLAIFPFPFFFAALSQVLFCLMNPGVPPAIFVHSLLASFAATLLFNGVSLLVSLHSRTVRSATQCSVLLSLPLFFLAQKFYREYFTNSSLPPLVLAVAVAVLLAFSWVALRKFKTV